MDPEGHKMDDGSIDPYQPNAAWIAVRGNRIEFPSTERGKRQECGGLDSECMCVYVQ